MISQETAYRQIQDLFKRGIVTVVGSGASCAYGLPTMDELSTHVMSEAPRLIEGHDTEVLAEWQSVEAALTNGDGLETALGKSEASEALSAIVAELVAECVLHRETNAVDRLLGSGEETAFGRLFRHLVSATPSADVITTNYDRLLEVHAAISDVRVDTMFYGHTVGRFGPDRSRSELSRVQVSSGRSRSIVASSYPHIRLSKPHGSLDWYSRGLKHYRSDLTMAGARRIIAPGGSKYRLGYEAPFDSHRERANAAIDKAEALLFVGYGFNDEHLQTHVRARFPLIPSLIVSKELTPSAFEYLSLNSEAIGVEMGLRDGQSFVHQGPGRLEIDRPIWDLDSLLKEVLAI